MSRYDRYNASAKGKRRRDRYDGSVKGLARRLADNHRKRDRKEPDGPGPS